MPEAIARAGSRVIDVDLTEQGAPCNAGGVHDTQPDRERVRHAFDERSAFQGFLLGEHVGGGHVFDECIEHWRIVSLLVDSDRNSGFVDRTNGSHKRDGREKSEGHAAKDQEPMPGDDVSKTRGWTTGAS